MQKWRDNIGLYIIWNMYKYKGMPKSEKEAKGSTILWDFAIQADKKNLFKAINQI